MLQEFMNISQKSTGFRRLFTDENFQLYVWYTKKGGALCGFQLVYSFRNEEKALTWTAEEGFTHTGIDEGDTKGFKRSPILIEDGAFPYNTLYGSVTEALQGLEPGIRDIVLVKITEYSFNMKNN